VKCPTQQLRTTQKTPDHQDGDMKIQRDEEEEGRLVECQMEVQVKCPTQQLRTIQKTSDHQDDDMKVISSEEQNDRMNQKKELGTLETVKTEMKTKDVKREDDFPFDESIGNSVASVTYIDEKCQLQQTDMFEDSQEIIASSE